MIKWVLIAASMAGVGWIVWKALDKQGFGSPPNDHS